jgi:hypothetical protein
MSNGDPLCRARRCHQNLTFWLGAALHNARQYIVVSNERALSLMMPDDDDDWLMRLHEIGPNVRDRQRLAEYNVLTSFDALVRLLKEARRIFPEIRPVCSEAKHLIEESKNLLALHDDADVRYKKLIPEDGPTHLPHAKGGPFPSSGYWIAGRLNVEQAVAEIKAIQKFARDIPYPYPE